jgi:cysteinyl-tRNA synthetase
MAFQLYNTLTRRVEKFIPLKGKKVGLYACGPTVYDYAHIGNLRSYITWDILKRALVLSGYSVKHVMNITDVGHLTDDGDNGVDKMLKGAAREHKTAWEIAEFYTMAFLDNLKDLNIQPPAVMCRATDHIKEQIKLIKKLEKKGFTYITPDGVYFDTGKLPDYGALAQLKKQDLRGGIRVEVGGKRHSADFALWKFSPKLEKRQMEWESPWGVGFPGWHIECSAMSAKYLGIPFDIHCGGIDHVPVHHTNEIAQTEAAEGIVPARYWVHNEFLNMGADKMSKSLGNFITIATLKDKKISPLAFRYFLLQTHYRKQLNFSWPALKAAQTGLTHLYRACKALPEVMPSEKEKQLHKQFIDAVTDDLDVPTALALVWSAVKEQTISQETLFEFDEVLGLGIKEHAKKAPEELAEDAKALTTERDQARREKNWAKSDELRNRLIALGYKVKDTTKGTEIEK